MKNLLLVSVIGMLLLASGCVGQINQNKIISAASNLVKAETISDQDLKNMSVQLRQRDDRQYTVASPKSPYTVRLNRLMAKLQSVNGIPLTYKVYMTKQVNANACPDGSVRVFSGLMDTMTDDELRFVIGHEIGHVALGHAKSRMQSAYRTAALRNSIGIYAPAAVLSDSVLGSLAESFLKAQYSQSNELEADAYGLQFLRDNGYPLEAAMTCLAKLQSSGGFFSTHPSSKERVSRIQKAIAKGGSRHN